MSDPAHATSPSAEPSKVSQTTQSGNEATSSSSKRTRRPKKSAPPLYRASVIDTADSASIRINSSTADINADILATMKKCLDRAKDPASTENEVKVALSFARRLMARHNVTQAEVLAHEDPKQRVNYAGQSVVRLERIDGDRTKKILKAQYLNDLQHAMRAFFDCKSYTTSRSTQLDITFYGIAESTVAAAMAFEMVYNQIVEWCRPYKGKSSKISYCIGVCDELYKIAMKEKEEEAARAKKKEEKELARRVREEEAHREAEVARLTSWVTDGDGADHEATDAGQEEDAAAETTPTTGLSDQEGAPNGVHAYTEDGDDGESEWNRFSDDEHGDCDIGDTMQADFDLDSDGDMEMSFSGADDVDERISAYAAARLHTPASPNPSVIANLDLNSSFRADTPHDTAMQKDGDGTTQDQAPAPTGPSPDEESIWDSHKQLMHFRQHASEIADQYIKDSNTKLRTSRKRHAIHIDDGAYRDGVRDGKKINVHRKMIKTDAFPNAQFSAHEEGDAEVKEEEDDEESQVIKIEDD